MLEVYQGLRSSCKLIGTQVDAGLRGGVFPGKWIPWARGIVGLKVPLHFGQFTYYENVWRRGATIGLLIVTDRLTKVL
jgi:hypothetical protein